MPSSGWMTQEQLAAAGQHRNGKRCVGIPHIQGREQRLHFAGAAMKGYPTSKVRETQDGGLWERASEGRQTENHNHRKLANLITWTTALSNLMKLGHAIWAWQNAVHWRREWQTTSVFLPWEPHEHYEKAKRWDTERLTPQVGTCPIWYCRSVEK